MAGRFIWASTSDLLGRKVTYFIFFTLGAVLYFFLPLTRADHLNLRHSVCRCQRRRHLDVRRRLRYHPRLPEGPLRRLHVSAIHGRLLTAWSTAGIVGPLIVNGILDHYVANKLPKQDAYPLILHIMSGLLLVGFVANFLVKPVSEKHWMKEQNLVPVGGGH